MKAPRATFRSVHFRAFTWAIGLTVTVIVSISNAWAFDLAGFKSRLDATQMELAKKSLSDSKATLARLDEMIKIGIVGAKEYGDKQPKFAKLVGAVNRRCRRHERVHRPRDREQMG